MINYLYSSDIIFSVKGGFDMWKRLLGMNTSEAFGVPIEEQIIMLKECGFDAFFTHWSRGCDIDKWAKTAKEAGMIYQSVHAPFSGVADLWRDNKEKADSAENEIIDCIHSCSDNDVSLIISHCYIGFDGIVEITSQGLERYGRIVHEAEKCGVNIAFENTEGPEYLAALLNEFKDCNNVGFCLDTGHEMCYNYGEDLLARWGDRLIATHLNDNLGIRDFGGKIFWHDDLHLLPFDGICDWDKLGERIKNCGYKGILTFELNRLSKPGRHENDKYQQMPLRDYFTEAYIRACKVAFKTF